MPLCNTLKNIDLEQARYHPEADVVYGGHGGIPTPLNNMKVSWDDDIPNICVPNQK